MLSSRFLALLTLVCTSALASPSVSSFVLHERRSHTPAGWSLSRRHEASATLPLRFGLKQSNIRNIEDYLLDVSHPTSPNYGKHWTAAEVAETFAPSGETVDAVRNWLLGNGISSDGIHLTPSKGWLEIEATVEEAENLMNTEYNVYEHETGVEHIGMFGF